MKQDPPRWDAPPAPPAELTLAPGEVHVWRIALDLPDGTVGRLYALLDQRERARAERMRIPLRRRRHVVAHGAKRQILARYLGGAAGSFAFTEGPHGKPALVSDPSGPRLELNLSHSHEIALLAVSTDLALGVDVERVRDLTDPMRLAERFFRPDEEALLASLPVNEKRTAFFRGWTRKEAFVKARGEALVAWLRRIEVPMLDATTPATIEVLDEEAAGAATPYTLVPLAPADGYEAALAVVGARVPPVRLFRWP